ncbi:hypothetical protein RND71_012993 [Anisodus tanguticus]|uniref:Uncharacterized protein n=1 Tax=Anisodus tanguticus TaxID=243964 RepID=A0AAE1SI54_9SOLA|nr:hypothetical protein RND71_012993 [Anisodus tanguticus]
MKMMKPLSSSLHQGFFLSFFKILSLKVKPIWIELGYFMILSLLGYLGLSVTKAKTLPSFRPKNLDVFFTSVSAATVSSMSTIEMEVFSDTQLVFMILLMFLGGEAFTSFLGLQLIKSKIVRKESALQNKADSFSIGRDSDLSNSISNNNIHHLDLGNLDSSIKLEPEIKNSIDDSEAIFIKLKCIRLLSYVVLGYILVVLLLGSSLVSIYINFIPSANQILKKKGLNLHIFPLFTTVSTFSNCGFAPTNENMMIFKKNSGLLLILIPQILLGNTLYPPCLRLTIWFLWKITKREEFKHILKDSERLGYSQLFPSCETISLAITVVGFIFVQFIVFCSLEWYSQATSGLSAYEKLLGSLFEVVNTRHAGESVFDLSTLTPAILIMFVFMMQVSITLDFFFAS